MSTNGLKIFTSDQKIYLAQNNLEKIFPGILKKHISNEIKKIYIINGPGSFTNLRIGTLTLNTINFLKNYSIDFFDIGKINFYKYLIKIFSLPSWGIIFIGQKKNAWLYDFKTDKYQLIKYEKLENISKDYFVDNIENFQHPNQIQIDYNKSNILVNFKGNNLQLPINVFEKISTKIKILQPNYMIKPNICM